MAQATILATGTTQATSTDVVVAAGASVTVGIFTADAAGIPHDHFATVYIDTPGSDAPVKQLSSTCPTTVISGPGTFRVTRRAGTTSFGVFTES